MARRGPIVTAVFLCIVMAFSSIVSATVEDANFTTLAIAVALRAKGYVFSDGNSGFLRKGGYIEKEVTLRNDEQYTIVAGGCKDALDVDIEVYDEHRHLIKRENSTNPLAIVADVTPRWTGTFYIRVLMANATPDGAHYVLLIGKQGLSSSPVSSSASLYTLQVENRSTTTIERFFISPSSEGRWGKDHLGDNVMSASDKLTIGNIPAGDYDIKMVAQDGRVCSIAKHTIRDHENMVLTSENLAACLRFVGRPG